MHDWLTHRASATPDDLAVIDTGTDTRWSYSGLDAAVDETAGRLVALGIESGDHVGMLMSTQLLSVCLLHAAQRLGLRLVPLNDRQKAETLATQIDHSDLSMLVCGTETEPLAVEAADSVSVASVDEPQWEDVESFQDVDPEPVEPVHWEFKDPQLMVFTSGSTGTPKAVVLTMGNLLASAAASGFRLGIDPDDRWLLTLALYHVGGIAPVLRSTLYGTAIVLRSSFDPGAVADDIERYDVTVVSLVPTMLSEMLERRGTLSDSLRSVLLGGAPAPESLIERCRNYSIPVFPTYGMTETASQIATARPVQVFERSGTVGRPLLWTELTIIDDAGQPVESGQQGEIVVSGPMVTAGYYNDVDANVEAFCEHGLRTGDIGYRTDKGYLYVLNRLDDRIISGGENIDPGEIVDVLRSHPDIDEAAVVGIPDETWGERVAALIVPKTADFSEESVESFCRERLAGYKLPRLIAFAETLPRTASGTVKRPAIRTQLTALADSDNPDDTSSDRLAIDAREDIDEPPANETAGADSTVNDTPDEKSAANAASESDPTENNSPDTDTGIEDSAAVEADVDAEREAPDAVDTGADDQPSPESKSETAETAETIETGEESADETDQ